MSEPQHVSVGDGKVFMRVADDGSSASVRAANLGDYTEVKDVRQLQTLAAMITDAANELVARRAFGMYGEPPAAHAAVDWPDVMDFPLCDDDDDGAYDAANLALDVDDVYDFDGSGVAS